ncbi:hypothetical protein D0Z00_001111 [Geotrichum galactomycetum]|uniref:Uncharacterized protein n=1 Tax=Geotrichum galactomycetum TaxID=27317 RepID=A0ACB6V7Y7_9ASCO|nr:hypothetical protein D0Z00_001111 [Geotrichum candidum]
MGKSGAFTYGTMGSGPTEAGNVLSFGATIYGYATGWTSLASDYTVYMNKRVSRPKIYLSVLGGLNFPLILTMTLGAACATGTVSTPSFAENYEKNSIGGLFFSILVDNSLHGFGQFCVVLLALSTVSNNTPNLYSFGLSIQSLWDKFKLIPRIVWTVVAAGASLAISIPGYIYFEVIIDNFMNLIGYWLAIYSAISLSEHFFYKKGFSGYNPDAYDTPSLLPVGLAAGFAFACGIAGAILGMNQIWWQGPLAGKIGEFGGDIGSILGFSFAFVAFNLTRKFELNRFGR